MDYSALAASAGVVWDDLDKFTRGHIARVLLADGSGFYHPCTCSLAADHDALVPTNNPESTEPPLYVPLPDPEPIADPVAPTDPAYPTDPNFVPDENGTPTDV